MSNIQQSLLTLLILLEWFALLIQFYPNFHSKIKFLVKTTIWYFSYFTLDNNLNIGIHSTCLLILPRSNMVQFFLKQTTQTVIAIYLFIVCLIYNLVLRFILNP